MVATGATMLMKRASATTPGTSSAALHRHHGPHQPRRVHRVWSATSLAPVCAPDCCRSMGSGHKGVAALFFFEQRAVQDRGVAPLFRTKEATSKNSRREHPQPSREPPRRGFTLRACLSLCCLRACVCAGSCNETNMTIRACLCL
jgi:hypothetical protein